MVTKKDALILGVLAVGGVAVASSIAGGDTGGGKKPQQRFGTILGSPQTQGTSPTIYNIPGETFAGFPEPSTFDISRFLQPKEDEPSRGAAGVSAAPKKTPLYTPGAYVTPVPVTIGGKETYVPATTFPAAYGIHKALETARSYGGVGGSVSTPTPKKKPRASSSTSSRSYGVYGVTTGGGVR